MKTTKITLQAEIYDDPEFCRTPVSGEAKCRHLKNDTRCRVFSDKRGNNQYLGYNFYAQAPLKCDQCKEALLSKDVAQEVYDELDGDGAHGPYILGEDLWARFKDKYGDSND